MLLRFYFLELDIVVCLGGSFFNLSSWEAEDRQIDVCEDRLVYIVNSRAARAM